MLSNILKKSVEKSLSKIKINKLIIIYPDNTSTSFGFRGKSVKLNIKSWKTLWLAFTRGDIGLAEGYLNNYWTTNNILDLMEFFSVNVDHINGLADGKSFFKIFTYFYHLMNKNSISGSKKNILSHYDLGNNFF